MHTAHPAGDFFPVHRRAEPGRHGKAARIGTAPDSEGRLVVTRHVAIAARERLDEIALRIHEEDGFDPRSLPTGPAVGRLRIESLLQRFDRQCRREADVNRQAALPFRFACQTGHHRERAEGVVGRGDAERRPVTRTARARDELEPGAL